MERQVLVQLEFNVNKKHNIYHYYHLCFNNILVFIDDIVNHKLIRDVLYDQKEDNNNNNNSRSNRSVYCDRSDLI